MTVIFKSKLYFTKRDEIKEFYEKEIDNNTSPTEWAYWAGWMDSDGSFSLSRNIIELDLIDRNPCELFSKKFGGSLRSKVLDPNLYKNRNPKTLYRANLTAQTAIEFSKRIHKYLLFKDNLCKNFLKKVNIESDAVPNYECSDEIFIAWLTGFIEGDGTFGFTYGPNSKVYSPYINAANDSISLLKYIQQRTAKMGIESGFHFKEKSGSTIIVAGKESAYKRKNTGGAVQFTVKGTRKLAQLIYPHMTLLRKKQKCLKILLNDIAVIKKPMTVNQLNENINQQKGADNA